MSSLIWSILAVYLAVAALTLVSAEFDRETPRPGTIASTAIALLFACTWPLRALRIAASRDT